MDEYLELMRQHHLVRGEWEPSKVSGLPPKYFWDRYTYVDMAGDLRIHNMMTLGPHVKTLTASHDFSTGSIGKVVYKRVWIDESAFVGGFSILYNCHLQHHCIVACGSVVRNMTVPPWTMVEGNPARPIKRFENGKWVPIEGTEHDR